MVWMWETERRLWVASDDCEGLKIEKYREKCMKRSYASIEACEIYDVWELKSENVSDGETSGSGFWRLWRYKDWEIHEIDLRSGEIYRMWELKSENVRDGEVFVSDIRWFWMHKDCEIQRKCVKSPYDSLEAGEIYRVWELKEWECERRRGVCEWSPICLNVQRLRNTWNWP